jgi:hypothetical protein
VASCYAAVIGLYESSYGKKRHCERRDAIFVIESTQRSQASIATPRAARLAMTFFQKPLDHFHDSLCPTLTGMKVDWVIG